MHLIAPIRSCIDEILEITGSGLKSMILDEFTTGVVGSSYTRSEMLLREVYLFEYINTIFESTERLSQMKCIVILRSSKDNVENLCRELKRPHYRTYHIYFTSRLGSTTIQKLAEADEREVVRCVRELPINFQPITPFLFSLKLINKTYDLRSDDWQTDGLRICTEGLASTLIALRVNPYIRYQTQSRLCKILAEKVGNHIKNESFRNINWRKVAPFDKDSLLLIVDRRIDLISPIINKWTYYAMIHEFFDIQGNNRINLVDVPNRQAKDPKEMLISMENDQFFQDNYNKNYGELGTIFKMAIEDLKTVTKSSNKIETMEDMRKFIDEYPETKRYASNLHNHVFLMSEISRLVTEHHLLSVSECEQELACSLISDSEIIKKIKQLVASDMISPNDALRLCCLYSVCTKAGQRNSIIGDLLKLLKNRKDIKKSDLDIVKQIREFSRSKPQNQLDEKVEQVARKIVQGVKGVDNVLTQYKPHLSKLLDGLKRSYRLKEVEFAFSGERYKEEAPKRVIIFFVGGLTYDEAILVDQFNRSNRETKVIVGGTTMHNFRSFIGEVREAILYGNESAPS